MARVQQQQQHYATFNNNQINHHTPYAPAQDAAGQRMESTVGINWFRRIRSIINLLFGWGLHAIMIHDQFLRRMRCKLAMVLLLWLRAPAIVIYKLSIRDICQYIFLFKRD
uniref:Uncharacterized protein n=1 Tax=Oryza barthii TaxID=65489 RepID=A0A0D3GJV5_9ORYZ